jgi:hypothetical protein
MEEAIQGLRREIALSIQTDLVFKFHVLLECSEWRMTTLGHGLLQFSTKTQKIVDDKGRDFQHPLTKNIWELVLKCTRLGDGDMITVLVPFNDTTGEFDWKTPNCEEKRPSVRLLHLPSFVLTLVAVGYEFLRLVLRVSRNRQLLKPISIRLEKDMHIGRGCRQPFGLSLRY